MSNEASGRTSLSAFLIGMAALFGVPLGLLNLLIGCVDSNRVQRLEQSGIETNATVTNKRFRSRGKPGSARVLEISYQVQGSGIYTTSVEVTLPTYDKVSTRQSIRIRYMPNDPYAVLVVGDRKGFGSAASLIAIAIGAGAFWWVCRPSRSSSSEYVGRGQEHRVPDTPAKTTPSPSDSFASRHEPHGDPELKSPTHSSSAASATYSPAEDPSSDKANETTFEADGTEPQPDNAKSWVRFLLKSGFYVPSWEPSAPGFREALVQLVEHPDETVRDHAATMLGALPASKATIRALVKTFLMGRSSAAARSLWVLQWRPKAVEHWVDYVALTKGKALELIEDDCCPTRELWEVVHGRDLVRSKAALQILGSQRGPEKGAIDEFDYLVGLLESIFPPSPPDVLLLELANELAQQLSILLERATLSSALFRLSKLDRVTSADKAVNTRQVANVSELARCHLARETARTSKGSAAGCLVVEPKNRFNILSTPPYVHGIDVPQYQCPMCHRQTEFVFHYARREFTAVLSDDELRHLKAATNVELQKQRGYFDEAYDGRCRACGKAFRAIVGYTEMGMGKDLAQLGAVIEVEYEPRESYEPQAVSWDSLNKTAMAAGRPFHVITMLAAFARVGSGIHLLDHLERLRLDVSNLPALLDTDGVLELLHKANDDKLVRHGDFLGRSFAEIGGRVASNIYVRILQCDGPLQLRYVPALSADFGSPIDEREIDGHIAEILERIGEVVPDGKKELGEEIWAEFQRVEEVFAHGKRAS